MKISKETIDVLKNLASINLNILIKEGNVLTTKSPANTIVAEVEVAEDFEKEFGIYDLSRFLGVLGLYEDPEVVFKDKKVKISEGKYSVDYYGAEPEILTKPDKQIKFPDADIEFNVEATQIAKALKAASVLACNTFTFEGDGSTVSIVVSDITQEGSNKFKIEVGESDKVFKANTKIDNIKFLPLDYTVSISSKRIARFQTDDEKTKYYIALDSTSTFE